MRFAFVTVGILCCYYVDTSFITQIHINVQFQPHGVLRTLRVDSTLGCALECSMVGDSCMSFSVDKDKICRVSVLRLTSPVHTTNLVFSKEFGTRVFGNISVPMPSGNIALLDKQESLYIVGLSPVTWHTARDLCPLYGHGFQLASITSADEQDLLRSWLQPLVQSYVFVSGTDEQHEGCWLWANPVISRLDDGFADWRDKQPDNWEGIENCLVLNYNLKLNDVPCHQQYQYLCKRSARDGLILQPSIDDVHSSSLC